MRPNDVDDSGTLPRRMLLKCGPLCPAAVEALTNTATEELEWKAEDGEEEGSKKKDNNSVAIEVRDHECCVCPIHIICTATELLQSTFSKEGIYA